VRLNVTNDYGFSSAVKRVFVTPILSFFSRYFFFPFSPDLISSLISGNAFLHIANAIREADPCRKCSSHVYKDREDRNKTGNEVRVRLDSVAAELDRHEDEQGRVETP